MDRPSFPVRLLNYCKRKINRKDNRLAEFFSQFKTFQELDQLQRLPLPKADIYPCLDDNTGVTPFDAHYIYHPAWAARIIKKTNPAVHVDISSTLSFCTIISAFVPTEFYDYRPAGLHLNNLVCQKADLTDLFFESNSIRSLSCMHTIEHIGLGRYGDPLQPEGDIKAFEELKRVCAPGGDLLIVVPVGIKKIQFNAHRIYDPFDIVSYMTGFELKNFSLIDDSGNFLENAALDFGATQKYGCGCFWFIKTSLISK